MSISSSLFRQNTNDISADMQDLRQQNRFLYQQNVTLKKSLEELISINTELTQSIEEFNNSHIENFPHINQQQIEQLALRVIELEQELDREKNQNQKLKQNGHTDNNGNTVEETLQVIEELVNSFRLMQEEYQQELQRIEGELEGQKNQWIQMSEAIQEKLGHFEEEFTKILQELRNSESVIKNLESELQDRSRAGGMSRKQMKISTTIEDLRMTLQRQIEQKDKIIKHYELILEGIRQKVYEKVR